MIQSATGAQGGTAVEAVARATEEVGALFNATDDSFKHICAAIESASRKETLRVAFDRLDKIMRIFYGVAPDTSCGSLIRKAVMSFQLSERLLGFFNSTPSPPGRSPLTKGLF